jgi:branched-chain amino acid transport system ATP-binding protein
MNKNTVLEVKNLTMRFGGLVAVNDLSFDVKEREIVGIIGPNGAGKTTVFNCITQFYKEDEGEIWFKDNKNQEVNLNEVDVTNVIDHGLVRTFQNVELVKDLSVIDNVLIGAHNQFKTNIFMHLLNNKKVREEDQKLREKALKILSFMHIDQLQYQLAYGQPYGVLKKIEIARTLMCDPKVIILDEPAAGLNDLETEELAEIIQTIRKEFDCSIVLIEHDMGFVMDICDRICAINFGKFLAMDTPQKIQQNKLVQEAYLGGEDDV